MVRRPARSDAARLTLPPDRGPATRSSPWRRRAGGSARRGRGPVGVPAADAAGRPAPADPRRPTHGRPRAHHFPPPRTLPWLGRRPSGGSLGGRRAVSGGHRPSHPVRGNPS
ncbi:hypothetical protein FTX61_12240 [Nitriliruptoraceae bacterium ZYF776]|nr:hypothetical protein [Profundirhabdus halotolerans]